LDLDLEEQLQQLKDKTLALDIQTELFLQQVEEEVMVDKLIHHQLLQMVALVVEALDLVMKEVTLLQKELLAEVQHLEVAEQETQDQEEQVALEEMEHLTQIFQV
jgi:hypothetical protein